MVFTLISLNVNWKAVGALHTILHRLGKDATYLFCLFVLFLGDAFAKEAITLPDSWRAMLVKKHLPHMVDYKQCIKQTALRTEIPELLIMSVLMQEGGKVGSYSVNRNQTKDHGPGQINDVRAKEISKIGLTLKDVRNDGCKNVIGVGFLLSNEIEKADGDLWTGVGNYHYSKMGKYPVHHFNYIKRVHSRWATLYRSLQDIENNNADFKIVMNQSAN